MSELTNALRFADEAYLTAFANKGLYKRALKELPDTPPALTFGEDSLCALFPDGTRVDLAGSIQGYTCTCPSRTVCKHVLMAVLAAQAQSGGEGDAVAAEAPPDFTFVSETGADRLEKLAGKKQFRETVFRVHLGAGAAIEEGSVLTVTLADTGHTVRFLPGVDITGAGCSCKSEAFCTHRLEAVLQVIKNRQGALPAQFLPGDEEPELEFSTYALPHIRQFLLEVFATGLARLPEETPHRFTQLAVICHSRRLANMERLANRAAGQLELFYAKNAGFRRDRLLGDLCEMLRLAGALEQGAVDKDTVGTFREQYRPIPAVDLYGLGAYQWHSPGGYTGVTVLFFCPELAETLTYTTALPDDTRPDAEKMYTSGAPWKLPTKIAALSHTHLHLKGGKVSGKNQLSSTDAATAVSQGATPILDKALAPLHFPDFAALLEALWRQRGEEGRRTLWAILMPARYGAVSFDEVSQRMTLPAYDSAERRLDIGVSYEPSTALLIENLQRLERNNKLVGPMLARVTLEGGRLSAFPVTLFGGEKINLSLDREKRDTAVKGKIDWGI